jgi:hypothetical protein
VTFGENDGVMPHPGVRFGIAALATWRVTHLLAEEDGPADLVLRARVRLGDSPLGTLIDCFQCLSLWVAAPFAARAPRRFAWWLGLSGAACLLERATGEDDDGLLWGAPGGAQDDSAAAENDGPVTASGFAAGATAAGAAADASAAVRAADGRRPAGAAPTALSAG